MLKDTPSMAKNKIRRSLASILDPHPSTAQISELWSYFKASCAYCGQAIERASRTGHLDHVESSASGGSNSIHNHVLACAKCNGDEKRDEHWGSFLERKAGVEAPNRRKRVEAWLARAGLESVIEPAKRAEADAIIEQAVKSFNEAVNNMRRLRRGA